MMQPLSMTCQWNQIEYSGIIRLNINSSQQNNTGSGGKEEAILYLLIWIDNPLFIHFPCLTMNLPTNRWKSP